MVPYLSWGPARPSSVTNRNTLHIVTARPGILHDMEDDAHGRDMRYCPYFQATLELIGRRWTGSILRALCMRAMRFSEISREIPGLSHRLLAERLKELEGAGLVERDPTTQDLSYRLTAPGHGLEGLFREVDRWNERWVASDGAEGR